ncbi:MAG: hypothetical protein HQM08_02820 [Candidatus Riflebacteria bacterium]|nr:hypothetical protein [Candidatus Riflebacteria bacterium]
MQKEKNMLVLETPPSEFENQLMELRRQFLRTKERELAEQLAEVTMDLNSCLPKWNLQNPERNSCLSNESISDICKTNFSILKDAGYSNLTEMIDHEASIIKNARICKLSQDSDQKLINNRLSHNDGTGLKHALRKGAVAVTTNPSIFNKTIKRFPEYWGKKRDEIKKKFPSYTLDQMAARIYTEVVLESARIIRPIFNFGNKNFGYVSLQLNPNISDNSTAMINEAEMIFIWLKEAFNGEKPNVVFKVPGTFAGLKVASELTSKGIGVNITVNYSVSQQLAFGEILEKGKADHCYLTQMNSRLEAPVAEEVGEGVCDHREKASSWSSTAVTKRAYKILYRDRGFRNSLLLGASINKPWHVDRLITDASSIPIHMTIDPVELTEFDGKLRDYSPCLSDPIDQHILDRLMKSDTFVKAYEPEKLKREEFDSFKPTLITLNGFRKSYDELLQWCR